MDLMDFEEAELYFDEPVNSEVLRLLELAAASYGDEEAEQMLLKAKKALIYSVLSFPRRRESS